MAKSKRKKLKPQELPGLPKQPGVSPVNIPQVNKAIDEYEEAKEARCKESPKELAAKTALKMTLQRYKAELPVNGEGLSCYLHNERVYTLEEKLVVKSASHPEADDD